MGTWTEHQKHARMQQDLQKVLNPDSWPLIQLCLKEQPWVWSGKGSPRFGFILEENPTVVYDHDTKLPIAEYDSVEELVRVWSVD